MVETIIINVDLLLLMQENTNDTTAQDVETGSVQRKQSIQTSSSTSTIKIEWPDITFGPINLWNVWIMTDDWNEERINIIGQNGNNGEHYAMSGGMEDAEREFGYLEKIKRMATPTTTTLVIEDLKAREKMGLAKYGEYVHQSKDDMLQHLYEELLDAALYIKTEIERRKEKAVRANTK